MKPIFKYLCIPALITLPVSSACADDNTDTFINKLISSDRGSTNYGDLNTYKYPDRNLFIKWTDDSRGDGSPIRNADVYAKNITIISDFVGNQWTDKGIISDNSTNIHASGDFSIITHDDSVYTQSNGTTNIDGFKKLDITSKTGYGLVDNGDGIYIKGGDGSKVTIKSKDRPAIANGIQAYFLA